jgi:heme iron utilization protein
MPTDDHSTKQAESQIRQLITKLLDDQRLAMLSTQRNGQPYASLVAIACTGDLRFLYFVTPRTTRKFNNLENDCRMALLISSSANRESDFHEAMAVTVVGSAEELYGLEKEAALNLYTAKHPYLEDFARSPTCALVKVRARSYILVKNFQQVTELHIHP